MSAEATAYGAVTVVNALATGKGAALGIDLYTRARVNLTRDGVVEAKIRNDEQENTRLAVESVRAVLDHFQIRDLGARVETESNIPIARGLKSSSVAANAIVLATAAALERHLEPHEILSLAVEASLKARVSVTGALDDAAASLYGNVVVTDNMAGKVLRVFPIEEYCVLLLVPARKSYTAGVDLQKIRTISNKVEDIHRLALSGEYLRAMTKNGLIYSDVLGLPRHPIMEGMRAGAVAAGITGKGPAYAFLTEEKTKHSVVDVLKRHEGEVIVSKTRNFPSIPMTIRST
jgi:shikimate kinase